MKNAQNEQSAVAAAAAKASNKSKTAEEQSAKDASTLAEIVKRVNEAHDAMLGFFKVPSWKRTLVAALTYIIGNVGVIWATSTVVEMLLVGAISVGAPMFLSIVIAVLAAVLLAWYGHKAVMRVAGAILNSEADDKAIAAYDATKRMLRRFNPFAAKDDDAVVTA